MNEKILPSAFAFLVATFVSAMALASPNYPATIVTEENITCRPLLPIGLNTNEPDCTLCHSTSAGGGAPTEPFGIALVSFGLVPNDTKSLQSALAKMDAAKTNSRPGDTATSTLSDIEMLKQCKNPNPTISVGYGCSSSGEGPSGVLWVALAAIAGAVIGRRRRR